MSYHSPLLVQKKLPEKNLTMMQEQEKLEKKIKL
jgi:hypothetical protein